MKTMLTKFHEPQLLMVDKGLKSEVVIHPKGFAFIVTYSITGALEEMIYSDHPDCEAKINARINTFKTGE